MTEGVFLKKELTPRVQELRNEPTLDEKHLWAILRFKGMGVKFRRQAVIGRYIVDFVCYEKKLIIEVDGRQHNQNRKDILRDKWLKTQGFKVLRYWNNDVLENLDGVYQDIEGHLKPPTHARPTEGAGVN